ncbi:MAG: hypothetical protein L0I29_02885 [Hyphomicrobiales bacterium]|nr:hypothetical protein [Hyphomicrobiales bacterium]
MRGADIAGAGTDDAVQAPPQTVIAALAPEQIPVPVFAERPIVETIAADVSTVPLPNWHPDEQSRSGREPERLWETVVASIAPVPDISARHHSNTGQA